MTINRAVVQSCHRHELEFAMLVLGVTSVFAPTLACGQTFEPIDINVQKQVNAVLALMGYSLTPDVTTGSIAISSQSTGNPNLAMSSLGGGFTISKECPLYLEGTAGYSHFDPTFIMSNGQQERSIGVDWNAVSVTAGIGWDFQVAKELVLRPIFNVSYGNVESDTSRGSRFAKSEMGDTTDFLQGGQLDAYGVGGSLILDYEHYRSEHQIDVELRYTNILLQSYDGTATTVQGNADAQSLSLWSRWRAPTGITMLERPLRYVIEYARTTFLGDLEGALGFNHLNSVGTGLELDSSKHDIIVTRMRLMARYKFGDNVSGWSIGLAVSF